MNWKLQTTAVIHSWGQGGRIYRNSGTHREASSGGYSAKRRRQQHLRLTTARDVESLTGAQNERKGGVRQ